MKKKEYMKPHMVVVKIQKPQLLTGSIQQNGDNLSITFGDDEFGDDETIY